MWGRGEGNREKKRDLDSTIRQIKDLENGK